jgi:hypothetical protein
LEWAALVIAQLILFATVPMAPTNGGRGIPAGSGHSRKMNYNRSIVCFIFVSAPAIEALGLVTSACPILVFLHGKA